MSGKNMFDLGNKARELEKQGIKIRPARSGQAIIGGNDRNNHKRSDSVSSVSSNSSNSSLSSLSSVTSIGSNNSRRSIGSYISEKSYKSYNSRNSHNSRKSHGGSGIGSNNRDIHSHLSSQTGRSYRSNRSIKGGKSSQSILSDAEKTEKLKGYTLVPKDDWDNIPKGSTLKYQKKNGYWVKIGFLKNIYTKDKERYMLLEVGYPGKDGHRMWNAKLSDIKEIYRKDGSGDSDDKSSIISKSVVKNQENTQRSLEKMYKVLVTTVKELRQARKDLDEYMAKIDTMEQLFKSKGLLD